jgi:rhodanese-related sulfurtransferase
MSVSFCKKGFRGSPGSVRAGVGIGDIVSDHLQALELRSRILGLPALQRFDHPLACQKMDFLLQNYNYLWIAVALSSGILLFGPMLRGNPNAVSPQQAVLLVNREDAIVIDVRDQTEFAAGHVPNARHIPLKEIEARSAELKKFAKRPFILVCQTGSRSASALNVLRKAGYERVFNLSGGVAAWKEAGQPLSRA